MAELSIGEELHFTPLSAPKRTYTIGTQQDSLIYSRRFNIYEMKTRGLDSQQIVSFLKQFWALTEVNNIQDLVWTNRTILKNDTTILINVPIHPWLYPNAILPQG